MNEEMKTLLNGFLKKVDSRLNDLEDNIAETLRSRDEILLQNQKDIIRIKKRVEKIEQKQKQHEAFMKRIEDKLSA